MKKMLYLMFVLMFLASCRTALQVPTIQKDQTIYEKEKLMEFIGFKNMPKNHPMFHGFGAELERRQIALNREDLYLGVYSLQELEVYKPTMRYISFIDVVNFRYTFNDDIGQRDSLAGSVIAVVVCGALIPVYVPMFGEDVSKESQLNLELDCLLYVYDTKKKDIVLSTPIKISEVKKYKGQYATRETDQIAVDQTFKELISKTLLKYYTGAYDFIKNVLLQ